MTPLGPKTRWLLRGLLTLFVLFFCLDVFFVMVRTMKFDLLRFLDMSLMMAFVVVFARALAVDSRLRREAELAKQARSADI